MTDTTDLRGKLATVASDQAEQAGDKPTISQLIDRQRTQIARALPKHMDADRLARIATTTIKTNPKLLQCSAESLLGALMLSAQTGLEPGPLAHAYLVPRRNKGTWECQWMMGYKGIIELARRSGRVLSIEAREVYERDEFTWQYGLMEHLDHRPCMDGDPGDIRAVWGLARFTDGGHYFVVLSRAQVDAHKARSDSAKKNYGPWISDYAAMARKTVIRVMAPYLPLSPTEAQTIEQDESVHTRISPNMVEDSDAWIDVAPPVDDSDVIDGVVVEDHDEHEEGQPDPDPEGGQT